MTELLRNWVLGITAASLLCAAAEAMTKDAPGRQAVRLVSALALLLSVVLPLRGYRSGDLTALFDAYDLELRRETAHGEARTDELLCRVTGESLGQWVEAQAAARGIGCRAQVGTVLREGGAVPVSCVITTDPGTDGAAAAALAREIAAALGIGTVTVRGTEDETG